MKITRKGFALFFAAALLLVFNSCIGMSMDIQMRKDGSGRIVMEYRISRMAESLGRFDGNENMPVIPAGRADLERTVARIPGIKIASFSTSENSQDIIINATLEFSDTDALLKYLDPSGTKASLSKGSQSTSLSLILNDPLITPLNEDLIRLMRENSSGYNFSISFSAPQNSTLIITDGTGIPITPPASASVVPSGKKTSFLIAVPEAIAINEGLGVIFNW